MKVIILALIGFALLVVSLFFLLKDFSRFIWRRTKNVKFPNQFIDFGEHLVTIFTVCCITAMGFLFYKFSIGLIAYLFADNLTSFFILMRGVFTSRIELQNPLSPENLLSGLLLTPALQFTTIYLIFRAIRTFMYSVNNHYKSSTYSEGHVLYFGFVSVLLFILLEIVFFSQKIPGISGIAHFTYLSVSKIAYLCYFLTIAHLHLLKYEHFATSLPTYFQLNRFQNAILFTPWKIILLTYSIGIILHFPFYTGIQFAENNWLVLVSYLFVCGIFYLTLKVFLAKGYNYMGVVLIAESPDYLAPSTKLFEQKTEMKVLAGLGIIALLLLIIKTKLFFFILFFIGMSLIGYLVFHSITYFTGLAYSVVRSYRLKTQLPPMQGSTIKEYLTITVYGTAKAISPIFAFIFFIIMVFSLFPKKLEHKNESYINSVFDTENNPLYLETTDNNDCIPVAYNEIPSFFLKCLYLQEDRSFINQNTFFPSNFFKTSNWHGFSFALYYRMITGGGGSNLNNQLLKNIAFPKTFPQDVQRKFAETLAAYQLSLQFSTDEIVTLYLNNVSFNGGDGHKGVLHASLYTFGLPIHELNELEMLYLLSTLKHSSMFKTGNGWIDYKEAALYVEDIKTALISQSELWYKQNRLSKKELAMLKIQDLRIANKPYRSICQTTTKEFLKKVMRDAEFKGITCQSSISTANQQHISDAVKKFDTQFKSFKKVQGCDLYSSALVIDVKTGNVIAHYGSEGVTDLTQFAGGNPVGSIIKPFVLLEMLEAGFKFDNISLYDGQIIGKLTPNNYSGHFSNEYVGINEILGRSLNAPMVNIRQVTDPLTLYKSVEEHFAHMNISTDNFLNLDDAKRKREHEINYPLGSRNMTLYEIAQAYQTLFNGGKYLQLSVYSSAFDPLTNETKKFNQSQRQVYNNDNADLIATALNNAMQARGTGTHIKSMLPQDITFYVKTSTSDEAKHGYTVIYDGEILIVTYVSYGRIENEHLSLGVIPIPFESGGRSAGVLAADIYNELK